MGLDQVPRSSVSFVLFFVGALFFLMLLLFPPYEQRGGGRDAPPDFLLLLSLSYPVQQTTSGIGHRTKCFFSGWQPIRRIM